MAISRFENYNPSETFKWDAVKQTPLVDTKILGEVGAGMQKRYDDTNALNDLMNVVQGSYATESTLAPKFRQEIQERTSKITEEAKKTNDFGKAQRDLKAYQVELLNNPEYRKLSEDVKMREKANLAMQTPGALGSNWDPETKQWVNPIGAGEQRDIASFYNVRTPSDFGAEHKQFYTELKPDILETVLPGEKALKINPDGRTYTVVNSLGTTTIKELSPEKIARLAKAYAEQNINTGEKNSVEYRKLLNKGKYGVDEYTQDLIKSFGGEFKEKTLTEGSQQSGFVPTPKESDGGGGGGNTKTKEEPTAKVYAIANDGTFAIATGQALTYEEAMKKQNANAVRWGGKNSEGIEVKGTATLGELNDQQGAENGSNKMALRKDSAGLAVKLDGPVDFESALKTQQVPITIKGVSTKGKLLIKGVDADYNDVYLQDGTPASADQRKAMYNNAYDLLMDNLRSRKILTEVDAQVRPEVDAANKNLLDNINNISALYNPEHVVNGKKVNGYAQASDEQKAEILENTVDYIVNNQEFLPKELHDKYFDRKTKAGFNKMNPSNWKLRRLIYDDIRKSKEGGDSSKWHSSAGFKDIEKEVYKYMQKEDGSQAKYNTALTEATAKVYEERVADKNEFHDVILVVPDNRTGPETEELERHVYAITQGFHKENKDGTVVNHSKDLAANADLFFDKYNKPVDGIQDFNYRGIAYHDGLNQFVYSGTAIDKNGQPISAYYKLQEEESKFTSTELGRNNTHVKAAVHQVMAGTVNEGSIPFDLTDGTKLIVNIRKSGNKNSGQDEYYLDMPDALGKIVDGKGKTYQFGSDEHPRVQKTFPTEQALADFLAGYQEAHRLQMLKISAGK